jgi:hypothetical protein
MMMLVDGRIDDVQVSMMMLVDGRINDVGLDTGE